MKTALCLFVSTLALSFTALASQLTLVPGPTANNGVNISKSGTATIDGKSVELTTVGSGLRSKKVLVTNVKVYVAQLLVSSPNRFTHKDAEALASLQDSQTVAVMMTFLRTVDAGKVQVSFGEAFTANNIDTNAPAIKAFLDAVMNGGDATSGHSFTIVVSKNTDGSETLGYEDTAGKQTLVTGPKGFTQQIFSIFLGNPSDDGVKALKNSLIHSQE